MGREPLTVALLMCSRFDCTAPAVSAFYSVWWSAGPGEKVRCREHAYVSAAGRKLTPAERKMIPGKPRSRAPRRRP